jgi:NADH-quinone oxidoreductase subunit I
MDQEYELSRSNRFADMLLHKQDLAKSNRYYHQIHPTEATLVDAQLEAERRVQEAKAKAAAAKQAAGRAGTPGPSVGRPPMPIKAQAAAAGPAREAH